MEIPERNYRAYKTIAWDNSGDIIKKTLNLLENYTSVQHDKGIRWGKTLSVWWRGSWKRIRKYYLKASTLWGEQLFGLGDNSWPKNVGFKHPDCIVKTIDTMCLFVFYDHRSRPLFICGGGRMVPNSRQVSHQIPFLRMLCHRPGWGYQHRSWGWVDST